MEAKSLLYSNSQDADCACLRMPTQQAVVMQRLLSELARTLSMTQIKVHKLSCKCYLNFKQTEAESVSAAAGRQTY